MAQIRKENNINARISVGLTDEFQDIKSKAKDPSLSFVMEPAYKSQKEYISDIKEKNV